MYNYGCPRACTYSDCARDGWQHVAGAHVEGSGLIVASSHEETKQLRQALRQLEVGDDYTNACTHSCSVSSGVVPLTIAMFLLQSFKAQVQWHSSF
mmetsp:Transcript_33781/g.40804  ORF Transcript_33781/g.40804 Transcript_33781/m.40804 type:complete len:96 (+) Transcript_33781:937-1224(+)